MSSSNETSTGNPRITALTSTVRHNLTTIDDSFHERYRQYVEAMTDSDAARLDRRVAELRLQHSRESYPGRDLPRSVPEIMAADLNDIQSGSATGIGSVPRTPFLRPVSRRAGHGLETLGLGAASRPLAFSAIVAERQRLEQNSRDLGNFLNLDDDEFEAHPRGVDSVDEAIRINHQAPTPPTDTSPIAQLRRVNAEMADLGLAIERLSTRLTLAHTEGPEGSAERRRLISEYENLGTELHRLSERIVGLSGYELDLDDDGELVNTPDAPTTVTAFLNNLPVVASSELAEDDRDCNICQESYLSGCDSSVVRLPCTHIFGRQCLETWLTTQGETTPNTCPMCRRVLFEVSQGWESFTGDIRAQLGNLASRTDDDDEYTGVDRLLDSEVPRWHGAENLLNNIQYINDHSQEPLPHESPYFIYQHFHFIDTRTFHDVWLTGERSLATTVLVLYRLFIRRPEGLSSTVEISIAEALAGLMGRLWGILQPRVLDCPEVWTERGPPVSFLLDPAAVTLLETALVRLVQVEREGRGGFGWAEV